MADKPFKAFEREAARLFGGLRKWANSGERLDFESATVIGQCKLVRRLSLEGLTQLAEEMDHAATHGPPGKVGVVAVKVRRGRGRPSPMLIVLTAQQWAVMNGAASDRERDP